MQKNSNTFCSAKWDELKVNLNYNYVYACCKAEPIIFKSKNEILHLLNDQKENLLSGIQDSSCEYCWKIENNKGVSKRQQHQSDNMEFYKSNPAPKYIEVNLGNECNFQCTYCNPKFSSKWEFDVRKKPYEVFVDRYNYELPMKQTKTVVTDTILWLKEFSNIETLTIIGGEPLYNKNFFKIIDEIKSNNLVIATNLSCSTHIISRLLKLSDNYNKINISVSLDSTDKNAEFSRFGLNYNTIIQNLEYLLNNAPKNVDVQIISLMTSITVRDIANMSTVVSTLQSRYPRLAWELSYCRTPEMFSFSTLPTTCKSSIVAELTKLSEKNINGTNAVITAITATTFNNTLYNLMVHFLKEFSNRHNISIPAELGIN
jgi:organic radical activating enzyme